MKLQHLNRSVVLALRLADARKPCEPMISFGDEKPPFSPSPVDAPFPRSDPETVGSDGAEIACFLEKLATDREIGAQSVMIARYGRVIAEAAREPYTLSLWKNAFSESKTLTALAIGFLFDEGKLRLDERLADIFPERIPALQKLVPPNLNLRHLLTMTSLANFNEIQSMTSDDWVRDYFDAGFHGAAGSAFQYNSLNSFMLSAVVKEKSGMGLSDYLERKLFRPLAIRNYCWEKSPDGVEKGGWGLYIRPEDLLKVGELLRENGLFRGERLLSERWMKAMCRPHATPTENTGDFRYGFHVWVGKQSGSRLINGMFGQNVIVYPETGYSVAVSASNPDLFQQGPFYALCDRFFSQNSSPEKNGISLPDALERFRLAYGAGEPPAPKRYAFILPERTNAQDKFDLLSGKAAFEGKSFVPDRVDYSLGLMPRMMQAVENDYTAGVSRIAFDSENGSFFVCFEEGEKVRRIPVGIGRWQICRERFGRSEWMLGTNGRFSTDEDGRPTLILTVRFLETPFLRSVRFYLDGKVMTVRADEEPGKEFLVRFAGMMGGDILEKPLIGSALSRFDPDLLDYKLDAMFSPRSVWREELTKKEIDV